MNAAASIVASSTETEQPQQAAPVPLDLDALRQVVGGCCPDGAADAPGGSW